MTHTYPLYSRQKLADAVGSQGTYTFSLGTSDPKDLGITDDDHIAEIISGGRFDLTTWRKWQPKLLAPQPMRTLHNASQVAGYLYLSVELTGGKDGAGDITATYNPMESTTPRLIHLDPKV